MLAAEVPSPLKGLLRGFAPLLSKPQQDNLARFVVGFMACEGEKNVKGIGDSFVPHKDRSSLDRFVIDPKWDHRAVNGRRVELVEDELGLKRTRECSLIIDDTVVERYGGEGVGYHYDTKHGLVRGQCYVTEICSCNGATYPIDLRLYMPAGTSEKPFRSKIELACELIDEFDPPSKHTTVQFDEWYLCSDVVKHAEDRGFDWVSEAKDNRVLSCGGGGDDNDEERVHVDELVDRMKPFFRDVKVDGEIYQCLDAQAYMPKVRDVRLLFNCKADTKDVHNLCTSIKDLPSKELLKRSFERVKIESFHWDIKNTLGFGEYRFRESEAAIVHSHLVLLTYSLLLILKKRMEAEKQSDYSIGDACRWVRDRCLVSICMWIERMLALGMSTRSIIGMLRPQICT